MIMWLVGMMGTGKSSAGRMAAERLGVRFNDTDDVVAERMGCSIAQLWGSLGESAFRELEKVATSSLANKDGIHGTGGGVVLDADNREILKKGTSVVWLQASPDTLASRLQTHDDRPLVAFVDEPREKVLSKMLAERADLYSDVATDCLDTDALHVDQVAEKIAEIWLS